MGTKATSGAGAPATNDQATQAPDGANGTTTGAEELAGNLAGAGAEQAGKETTTVLNPPAQAHRGLAGDISKTAEISPRDRKYYEAREAIWRSARTVQVRRDWARHFAAALMQNPNVDKYVAGSPFDGHLINNTQTVGEHLAKQCWDLAVQFENGLKGLFDADVKKIVGDLAKQFDLDDDQAERLARDRDLD